MAPAVSTTLPPATIFKFQPPNCVNYFTHPTFRHVVIELHSCFEGFCFIYSVKHGQQLL